MAGLKTPPLFAPARVTSLFRNQNITTASFPTQTISSVMREATTKADRDFVFSKLHYYEKHPKKSQRFMDIFPIFTSSRAMEIVINDLVNYIRDNYDVQKDIAAIVGPEAEGFI